MHLPRYTHSKPSRRVPGGLLLALLAALAGLCLPAAADARRYVVEGRGFGHGVGMSQWGAYGFALEGRSAKRIVEHYYSGAKVGKTSSNREIRVLLDVHSSEVHFTRAKGACGKSLDPSRTYQAVQRGSKVRIERTDGSKVAKCGQEAIATPKRAIEIAGEGVFRGRLVARSTGEGLFVINSVELDDYIKGVIPNESPASWPAAALEAQAIAARSYALATDAGGDGFDQYDDTRSQVYIGKATEQPSTNRATRKTAGQVLRFGGEVIPAFFFSSSGGRTENVEYGFPGGSPRPYLVSVRDPFDGVSGNANHSWAVSFSRSQMEAKLGDLVKGRFKKIKILEKGATPRVVRARVVGTSGKTITSGPTIRTRLGLKSHWFKVKRQRSRARGSTAVAPPPGPPVGTEVPAPEG